MGVTFDAVEVNEDPATLKKVFIIKTKESGLLIGEKGETFQALSHIVRRFTDKDLQQPTDFSIDVNDYQKSVVDALKVKAVMLANRAADMKIDVEMEPMSSYERLIVHGALNGIPHIKTESVGDKRERRVVIKYVN
jgi:spoIIIJ-associated protein